MANRSYAIDFGLSGVMSLQRAHGQPAERQTLCCWGWWQAPLCPELHGSKPLFYGSEAGDTPAQGQLNLLKARTAVEVGLGLLRRVADDPAELRLLRVLCTRKSHGSARESCKCSTADVLCDNTMLSSRAQIRWLDGNAM